MKSGQRGEELREALAKAERSGAGSPYPEELRRAAVAYRRQREREGVGGVAAVAAELGVSGLSLARWSRTLERAEPRFRAVEVVVAERLERARTVVVHGPRGLRIEGLSVAEVAELLGRLS